MRHCDGGRATVTASGTPLAVAVAPRSLPVARHCQWHITAGGTLVKKCPKMSFATIVAPGLMLENFLPIPEAESLPFYPSVLKLVVGGTPAAHFII